MVSNTGILVTGNLPRRETGVFHSLEERKMRMIMKERSGM